MGRRSSAGGPTATGRVTRSGRSGVRIRIRVRIRNPYPYPFLSLVLSFLMLGCDIVLEMRWILGSVQLLLIGRGIVLGKEEWGTEYSRTGRVINKKKHYTN